MKWESILITHTFLSQTGKISSLESFLAERLNSRACGWRGADAFRDESVPDRRG